jgi:hypothetical protein
MNVKLRPYSEVLIASVAHNAAAVVGWCGLSVSKPELKASLLSALETKM